MRRPRWVDELPGLTVQQHRHHGEASVRILGASVGRPNAHDIVTGAHRYPSDIVRPGMMYGAVLRPPPQRATLTSLDTAQAEGLDTVIVVLDGSFVG